MSLLPVVLPVALVAIALVVFYIVIFGRKRTDSAQKKHKSLGKDHASILKEANRRLAQNPRDKDALLALGEIYFNDENFENAMKTYRVLMDLCAADPDISEYDVNVRFALSAMKCNQNEEAYKSLMFARTLKEEEFDVDFNLGYLEYLHKNYEHAVQLLSQARVKQPDHAPTLRHLGHSLFRLKRWAEAAALLRKALDQMPEDKESLFAVARCYHELGQNDQAIKIFSHLRADPQFGPSASLFAGTIHLQARQFGEAVVDFELGLKHENLPKEIYLELKYRLAATYIKQEEIADAIRILQEIHTESAGYRDVEELIRSYRELNTNQNLKIFLISATSEFVSLCRRLAVAFFPDAKVKISDISVQRAEYADILADVTTAKWEDVILFRFVRTTGVVGELILRDLYSRIKEVKAGRGFCLAAGTFSDGAKQFVEARLIDLVDKEQLTERLSTLDSSRGMELPSQPEAKPARGGRGEARASQANDAKSAQDARAPFNRAE